jgi:hypothetical protein
MGRTHPEVISFLAKIGKKGGQARAKNLPEAERKAISGRGGKSAWAGKSKEERARIMGEVRAARAKK